MHGINTRNKYEFSFRVCSICISYQTIFAPPLRCLIGQKTHFLPSLASFFQAASLWSLSAKIKLNKIFLLYLTLVKTTSVATSDFFFLAYSFFSFIPPYMVVPGRGFMRDQAPS